MTAVQTEDLEHLITENRRLRELLERQFARASKAVKCAGCDHCMPASWMRDGVCIDCWKQRAEGVSNG